MGSNLEMETKGSTFSITSLESCATGTNQDKRLHFFKWKLEEYVQQQLSSTAVQIQTSDMHAAT